MTATVHMPETVGAAVVFGESAPGKRKLNSVQYLRAIAAVSVVAGHLFEMVSQLGGSLHYSFTNPELPTGAGVDLFFVISGFIMVFASRKLFGAPGGARLFVTRRLIRIAPLYWAISTIMVVLAILGSRAQLITAPSVIASYLFFPYDTMGGGDGYAFPILDLGWTLNYEMMFYALFAGFIGFQRDRCVKFVTIALIATTTIGLIVPTNITALYFWTRQMPLEFVAGMWLAVSYQRGLLNASAFVRLILVVAAASILIWQPTSQFGTLSPRDYHRVIDYGVPAVLLLAAAIGGALPMPAFVDRSLTTLGDASYFLYLTHPLVLLVVKKGAPHLPGALHDPAFLIAGGLVAAIAIAMTGHLWIEKPVTTWLTRWIDKPNPLPAAAPSSI
jgi:peptidoglycan/LPS O-acetylase OafA/YrhL